MRILTISDVYFPRVNGVSTSIQTFKHELDQLGAHTTLIAPSYPAGPTQEDNIIRIASRYLPMDPEDRMMRNGKIMQLAEQLRREEYDLVHIQTPFIAHYAGIKLAKLLGLPTVETYHTLFEEYLFHYIPYLPKACLKSVARWFTRHQCNNVNAVIAPSSPMLEKLREYGVHNRIEIIPTGMQMGHFMNGCGERFRQAHNIPLDRPTLVHVGRVAFEKNIDFILKVLQQVKKSIANILLVIAGEGPALSHLKKLSKELQLEDNILFVGYLSRDKELLDCYRAGDAFVFASRTETQGLVLLEAMAVGTPVVSTAIMGTKDILGAAQGCLVAEDDLGDFTSKVERILTDSSLREKLSIEAKAYAATWSANAMAKKMQLLYAELIDKHKEK